MNDHGENRCEVTGLLVRNTEKQEVAVGMEWHLDHSLSKEFKSEFLKLRCKALESVFGSIKGVQGLVKHVQVRPGIMLATLEGTGGEKIVSRPKECVVLMGFIWPNVKDAEWPALKEKFKDVFAPATLHGGDPCEESDDSVHIASHFKLAEKGTQ
jgi:hypothetical protein